MKHLICEQVLARPFASWCHFKKKRIFRRVEFGHHEKKAAATAAALAFRLRFSPHWLERQIHRRSTLDASQPCISAFWPRDWEARCAAKDSQIHSRQADITTQCEHRTFQTMTSDRQAGFCQRPQKDCFKRCRDRKMDQGGTTCLSKSQEGPRGATQDCPKKAQRVIVSWSECPRSSQRLQKEKDWSSQRWWQFGGFF